MTGLSPSLGMLSSSAPNDRGWSRSSFSEPSGQPIPLNRQNSDQAVASFYQPRHATPFVPTDAALSAAAPTSSIFAYQPPPPHGRPISGSNGRPSPPSAYQNYNAPMSSSSTHSQGPFGSSGGHSQYSSNPSHFPPQQRAQSSHSQLSQHMAPQHGLNASTSANGYSPYQQPRRGSLASNTIPSPSTNYDYATNHPQPTPQQIYATYTIPPSQTSHQGAGGYAYPESRDIYSDPRQPSGMVMPLGSGDLDEERHGLGLGSAAQQQLRTSGGRGSTAQDLYGAAGAGTGAGGPMLSSGGGLGSDDDRFAPRSVKREPHETPQWWGGGASNHSALHQPWGGPVKDEYS